VAPSQDWPGPRHRRRGFAGPTSRRLTRLLAFRQQHPPGLCRPPACPNRGVTLSSGFLLRYSKPPLNIPDQLQQLRDRGLLVGSDDLALNALELIGYYRLSAYWLFFEEPPASGETRSHRFKPGSTFEQVIDLYNKDRLIRLLVIDAIERIEIAARSAWVQEMSIKHGPHCYLDPQLFRAPHPAKRPPLGTAHRPPWRHRGSPGPCGDRQERSIPRVLSPVGLDLF